MKGKPIIPPICFQNIDNKCFDTTEPILSHTYWALHIASISTLFRSDLSPFGFSNLFNRLDLSLFDHIKTDKEPVGEFL